MSLQPDPVQYLHGAGCSGRCGFRTATRGHHDRLLAVDQNLDVALDLMELAVTWGELDYSGRHLIPPSQWLAFADRHRWQDRERAERIFALAADMAMHSTRVAAAG